MMTSTSINDNVVEVRKLNQYLGAFIASLGGFALGISLGWNSSASIVLRDNLDATVTEIGLIGAVLNAGICLGAILIAFIAGQVARPRIMFVMSVILFLSWIIIIGSANQKVILFLLGRSICGICGGVFCVLTPIYIAEIASKEIRSRLLALYQILINCGIMYAFFVAHVMGEHASVLRYSTICGIACISIASTILLPESPLYYLLRNDETNAEKSLRWYRGDTYDVQHEISEMKRLIRATESEKFSMKLLRKRQILRSLVSCFGVILGQHLCGVNMMTFYALTLFDTSGSGELTASEQTLLVGAIQILVSLSAMFLIDVFGRRILLTVSSLLMGLFLILLGWFFSLRDTDPEYEDIYYWMPPTWTALIFAAYNLGLGPISWSMLGDSLPQEMKTPVASAAVAIGWLFSLVASLTFEDLVISVGTMKVMYLSAAICWLIGLFCAIVIKDNTGKSLTEIQEEFSIDPNSSIRGT